MNERLKLYTFDNKFDYLYVLVFIVIQKPNSNKVFLCRLFDYLLTIPVNCNACMGKCDELYPCLKQVQHSFIEYKNYMYMFKSLTVNLIICGCY